MKKRAYIFFSVISFTMMVVLAACGADSNKKAKKQKVVKTTIVITENNGKKEISKKNLLMKPGETLYQAMKNYYDVKEKTGMITAINGISQNEKTGKYWLVKVNGKMSTKGAQEIKLKDGDQITWDLHEIH